MLQVKVAHDSVRIGRHFSVSFQRTLRIPEDGRTYPLPPGLGSFPIRRVADFADRVPASWREHGGVFIPMYQREALWLSFNAADWRPNAVKIGIGKVNAISEQGKLISVQFNDISENLATATKYFAESAGLIREEVAELKVLVGQTAIVAKDKVELVSNTIDRTQLQVITTTDFIQKKVVEPAREIAAIMSGVRKGLEVLFAPAPKQIDRVYVDDEMFIG